MANRDLPNVYTTLNDMSALIEGDESLITGITLRANRGPVGVAYNPKDSSDFLTKYTLSGKPGVKQDSTFFDIIELLKVSQNVYISRAAHNPLYGGLLVKKEPEVGNLLSVTGTKENYKVIIGEGDLSKKIKKGDYIRVAGETLTEGNYGRFFVENVQFVTPNTQITVTESFASEVPEDEEGNPLGKIYVCVPPMPITSVIIADKFSETDTDSKSIKVEGKLKNGNIGDRVRIEDGFYTIAAIEYSQEDTKTTITFNEDVTSLMDVTDKPIKLNSLADPSSYVFAEDELCLITGIDQGAYNSSIGIEIVSSNETALGEKDCFKVVVNNLETGADVEEYLVSMSLTKKSIDGTNIHIKNVINPASQYIQVYTPDDEHIDETAIPASTEGYEPLGGGYDGDEVDVEDNIAALQVFADKSVPVSILVNGNNENVLYQAAMIAICESRLDCFAFLRTPKSYEKLTLPAQRVKQLINYKMNTLASSAVSATDTAKSNNFKPHFKNLGNTISNNTGGESYLAAMYGPHVNVTDLYNSRQVVIGADSIAAKQWLSVINTEGFPYAAAGPKLSTLKNISVDWKIGDESSEARQFNDASMNMIVYEARRKFYYFNTQNTLQIANSAFRNIGAVLNVLNIKETLAKQLKDYIQLPISNDLIESVTRTISDYMDGCLSGGRVTNYVLVNETTNNDISNNELHFVLILSPAYYAQKIYLVVNVVNAAFDFALLQSA